MGVPTGGGQSLGNATGRILIDTSSVRAAQLEVQNASRSMNQAFQAIGVGGAIAAIRQLDRVAGELSEAAAQAERTRNAFDTLAAGAGQNADEILSAMRAASRGMISDANLVLAANRAMLLGVARNGEELAQLLEVARVRGQAMGLSTTQAFTDIVTGIGRLSPMILDNLGIITNAKQTYDNYAKSLGRTSQSLTDTEKRQALLNRVLEESQPLVQGAADDAKTAADSFEQYATSVANAQQALGDLLKEGRAGTRDFWRPLIDGATEYLKLLNQIQLQGFDAVRPGTTAPRSGSRIVSPRPQAMERTFTDEQTAAIRDWAQAVNQIERQAANDRLDATNQYEQQRTEAIRSYEQTIAREARDFGIQRARAEEDHARALADVRAGAAQRELHQAQELARTIARAREDSADRLADLAEDLERNLAQRRADSAERVAEWEEDRSEAIEDRRRAAADRILEIEEDFARERTRALADHKLRELNAAAHLDARALFFEQARFRQESEERIAARDRATKDERSSLQEAIDQINEAHAERLADEAAALDKSINQANEAYNRQVEDEKEALNKRIAQANEAYGLELEAQRAADEQRIEEMEADFALRLGREDADRATRLGRLAQDHTDQLNEMGRAHRERLTQISTHAAEERTKLDSEFKTHLGELNLRNNAWILEQQRITNDAIEQFDKWWKHVTGKLALPGTFPVEESTTGPGGGSTPTPQPGVNPGPGGGAAPVQPTPIPYGAAVAASAFTSTQPMPMTAAAAGGGGSNFVVNFVINAVSSQTANDLYNIIDQRLLTVVRQAAGSA